MTSLLRLLKSKRMLFIAPYIMTFPLTILTIFFLGRNLSAYEYGLFSLFLTAVGIFSAVNSFGLTTSLLKSPESIIYRKFDILKVFFLGGFLALVFVAISSFFSPNVKILFLFIVVAGIFQAIQTISNGFYRGINSPLLYGESLISQKLIFLVLILLGFHYSIGNIFLFYILAFSLGILMFLWNVVSINRTKKLVENSENAEFSFIKLGFSLTIANIIVVFLPFWDRFIIAESAVQEIGSYSFNSDIAVKLSAFWLLWLKLVTFPEILKNSSDYKTKILILDKTLMLIVGTFFSCCMAILFFYQEFIFFLSKNADYQNQIVFLLLLLSCFVQFISYINNIKAVVINRPSIITYSSMIFGLLHILLSFYLVDFLGALGVALSLLCASIFSYVAAQIMLFSHQQHFSQERS